MLSDNLVSRVLLEPCYEERSLVVNLLEPFVVAVTFIVGVDAVRFNAKPFARSTYVCHFPVTEHNETWQIAR